MRKAEAAVRNTTTAPTNTTTNVLSRRGARGRRNTTGVLAGDMIARISVALGWRGAFTILGYGTLLTAVAAAVYLVSQLRAVRMELTAS